MTACPNCAATQEHWLGHEIRGVYDGVLFWSCTQCGRAWSRDWNGFGRRQQVADNYVQQINDMADAAAATARAVKP